ncbi:MAG: hypothetical protein GY811_27780 [Myxococcales bacterium]|nr:hypothetical protein [Myxococcales bacterium]
MPKTSTYFPPGEVSGQLDRYPSAVCPKRALSIAVGAILGSRDPEALARIGAEASPLACDAHCYFNRSSSLLGIVADENSRPENRLLPSSPGDESVRDHWMFFLSVPDLSEHGYWALVARDGSGVYVKSQN